MTKEVMQEAAVVTEQTIPTVQGITSIIAYIDGLVKGSIPQDFMELLDNVYGVRNVNRMIALGGVKYVSSIYAVCQQRSTVEGLTVEEVLLDERDKVADILDRIFGQE